jgi:hypothetical protein
MEAEAAGGGEEPTELPAETWDKILGFAMAAGESELPRVSRAFRAMAQRWREWATNKIARPPVGGAYGDAQLRLALSDRFKLLTSLPWEESRRLARLSPRALYFSQRSLEIWEARVLEVDSESGEDSVWLAGEERQINLRPRESDGGTYALVAVGGTVAFADLVIRYGSLTRPGWARVPTRDAMRRGEEALRKFSSLKRYWRPNSERLVAQALATRASVFVSTRAARRPGMAGEVTAQIRSSELFYGELNREVALGDAELGGRTFVKDVVAAALRLLDRVLTRADANATASVWYWDTAETCVCLLSEGELRVPGFARLEGLASDGRFARARSSISRALPDDVWGYALDRADPRPDPAAERFGPGLVSMPLPWALAAPAIVPSGDETSYESRRRVRLGAVVYEFEVSLSERDAAAEYASGGVFPLSSPRVEEHQIRQLLFLPADATRADAEYSSLLLRRPSKPSSPVGAPRVTEI